MVGTSTKPAVADLDAARRRSELHGVDPRRPELPYRSRPSPSGARLADLSAPILSRILDQLADSPFGFVLADRTGSVAARGTGARSMLTILDDHQIAIGYNLAESDIGTNGVGTSIEARGPAVVVGDDHHLESLKAFACVNAPIIHPVSRRVAGSVGLVCAADETHSLLLPAAVQLAAQIEGRLLEVASPEERMLLDRFLRARRRTTDAVLTINPEVLIATPAARRLISGLDEPSLWSHISAALAEGESKITLDGPTGRELRLNCRPVIADDEVSGAVVEISAAGNHPHRRRPGRRALPGLAGSSQRWSSVVEECHRMAGCREPLSIVGEPGTGRLSVAEAVASLVGADVVHVDDASQILVDGTSRWLGRIRRNLRPDTTVIIRRIDNLQPRVVAALSSMVESRPQGCRVITTRVESVGDTSRDLALDRLGIVQIPLPPLRERRDDIAPVARAMFAVHGVRTVPSDLIRSLERYEWPGNVAQLDRAVRSTVAAAGSRPIAVGHLPVEIRETGTAIPLHGLQRTEAAAIVGALATTGGNRRAAADLLGISRATLYRRISQYGLDDH